MEMEYSSSSRPVDTSLDLGISSYFNSLHRDHHGHALLNHRKEFTFPCEPLNLQVNDRESSPKEEPGVLVKELNRISSENKKLTEMLTCMCEKYNVLQTNFLELKEKNSSRQVVKRKARDDDYGHNIVPNQITESSSCEEETNNKRPKMDIIKNSVSRVLVRTDSSNINSLVVKDGYQWRKYGQKVTRDNPSPRAYFKCSFAPTCPVKKKVQRSVENKSVLVATYEGEHNHIQPCRAEFMFSTHQGLGLGAAINDVPLNPSPSNHLNVDNNNKIMVQGEGNNKHDEQVGGGRGAPSIFQQFLVQQMASSLTNDPNFTTALAAAISGRVLDHSSSHI